MKARAATMEPHGLSLHVTGSKTLVGPLSPRAVFCPTYGIAREQRPRSDGNKANKIGWALVRGFWTVVVLLIVLAAI